MESDAHSEVILRRLTHVCIAITAGISGAALIGWALNWLLLARISPSYIPMAPSTALSFFVLSGALLVYVRQPESPTGRMFAKFGAFLILFVCFIILIDFFTGAGLDIEQLLYLQPEKLDGVPIGRMSPITAANFLLAGFALLLLLTSPAGRQRAKGASACMAAAVFFVGLVMVLGYLYGTPLLYGGTIIPVALTTASAFVFLGVGLITAAGQEYWPVSAFTGSSVSARLMRVFLPVSIVLILISGWLNIVTFPLTNNHVMTSSLVAILSVIIISTVISKIAQVIGGDIDRTNTERKQAEEALRISKEFLETVFNSVYDSISIIDTTDFIIIGVNQAFLDKLNMEEKDVIGKHCYEVTHHISRPCEPPTDFCPLPETLKTGDYSSAEHIHYDKDGREIYVEISTSPIRNEKGEIYQVVHVARDITERKKAEEIRLENLRLEAADKAKSEFLASMSHELRTPLNASIGFSELLMQGLAGELSEKQKHYVDNVLTSNQFLLSLINDILDLSKIEAGKIELVPEKMSIPVSIKETLTLIKEKAMKHKVNLKTEFDPALEFIEADKQRFKQILFNLLSNAVKFSKDEGGIVTISTKKADDMAQISVSDTGIGIKEEKVGRLFNKFEQLEPGLSQKYGGTGLGLAITKQLVELHGGRIWAESKYGEGSTFTFALPLKAMKEKK